MSNKLKVSITGGEDQGRTVELDLFTSLLVGRSRKADIRLHEADVSGRHFEFVRGTSGCCVKDLSRNGLKVDGRTVGEGEVVPINPGAVIEVGAEAKLTVDELPGVVQDEAGSEVPSVSDRETTSAAEDFFSASDADKTESAVSSVVSAGSTLSKTAAGDVSGEAVTHGDFEDALTEVGEGETQEMKTRVGSMEEIYSRKRQLDRASTVKRWKFGAAVVIVLLVLTGVWFYTGSRRHVSDAEGPYIQGTEKPDLADWDIYNEAGDLEFSLEFPRDDKMKIVSSADSNSVDVVSYLGVDRDLPFHLEFKRWSDPSDLQNSLEDSFEKRIRADSEAGMTFEMRNGCRPQGEFFDSVFPGFCEQRSQHGFRFVRAEFTRSVNHELRHGVALYWRNGDMIYQLRTEIPDMYWKRGGYRLTGEPHLAVFSVFIERQWDSPGRAGVVSDEFSDDYLLKYIKRELAVERASSWKDVAMYIDTLLIRSWDEKPVMQKMAMSHYRTFLDRLERFYNERHLAFKIARANGDEKRMRTIFTDVKTIFGQMPRDRRSSLVFDPEVWACRHDR